MPATSRAKRRPRFGALGVASVLLWAFVARGDSRVPFLADRLAYPPAPGQKDDFRVRTNAALALGATDDDAAVTPLCGGLADPSEVVRQAVAVGLRRLARPSAIGCLKDRVSRETSALVKGELARSLDALGNGRSKASSAPAYAASAKYYVAISHVANHTSRPSDDVDRVVRDSIGAQLQQNGLYQLAPDEEGPASARAAMARRQLKGYFLAVSVEKFEYTDEGLRVRVKIAVFSYPGRDLRGEVPASGMLQGARPGDKAAEDQLMGVIAGRAAELFSQNFQ
jgi:HEAT repeats